jgi:hypothetical protein
MTDQPHGLARGLTNYGDADFSRYLRRSFAKSIGYSGAKLARPVIEIAKSQSGFNNGCIEGRGPRRGEAIYGNERFAKQRLCPSMLRLSRWAALTRAPACQPSLRLLLGRSSAPRERRLHTHSRQSVGDDGKRRSSPESVADPGFMRVAGGSESRWLSGP